MSAPEPDAADLRAALEHLHRCDWQVLIKEACRRAVLRALADNAAQRRAVLARLAFIVNEGTLADFLEAGSQLNRLFGAHEQLMRIAYPLARETASAPGAAL